MLTNDEVFSTISKLLGSQARVGCFMHFDFIVVGGGAYGCATSYHLAKAGFSVAVIEAKSIASGASGGFGQRGVRGNRRDLRELDIMRDAYERWPGLAEELGQDTGYVRTGGMILVEQQTTGSTGGLVAIKTHVSAQNNLGIPTEYWDGERIKEHYPSVSPKIVAGTFSPLDGVASHQATTIAYSDAAQEHGAVLLEHTMVTSLLMDQDGRALGVVTAEGTTVQARQAVVLTSNVGAVDLARDSLGFEIPVWPILPQAVLLRAQNTPTIPFLTGHDSRSLSVKMLEDEIIMLSGGWRGRWNPDKGLGEVVAENLDGNIQELRSVFPDMGELTVLESDASRIESAAIDQIPFVDRIPGTSNVLVATGWTGHGWALLPSITAHLADWLATGQKPDELNPFSLTRTTRT